MEIIDTHTHIFREERYRTYFSKAKNRIGRAIVIHSWNITEEKGSYFPLRELSSFVNTKKDLYLVGSVDMEKDVWGQAQELETYFKKGQILGIKLYPGYQYFYPSDGKIFPIAELCEKYNKPLIFHSGDVYDAEKKAILKYSHPIHVDELATKFPKCKIVIAHFGFPYHMETANIVSKNENVYTDTSGTLDQPDTHKEGKIMLDQYARDLERVFAYFPNVKAKTMFGTDYCGEKTSLNQVEPYIRLVERIWNKNERSHVFHGLANKLFFS